MSCESGSTTFAALHHPNLSLQDRGPATLRVLRHARPLLLHHVVVVQHHLAWAALPLLHLRLHGVSGLFPRTITHLRPPLPPFAIPSAVRILAKFWSLFFTVGLAIRHGQSSPIGWRTLDPPCQLTTRTSTVTQTLSSASHSSLTRLTALPSILPLCTVFPTTHSLSAALPFTRLHRVAPRMPHVAPRAASHHAFAEWRVTPHAVARFRVARHTVTAPRVAVLAVAIHASAAPCLSCESPSRSRCQSRRSGTEHRVSHCAFAGHRVAHAGMFTHEVARGWAVVGARTALFARCLGTCSCWEFHRRVTASQRAQPPSGRSLPAGAASQRVHQRAQPPSGRSLPAGAASQRAQPPSLAAGAASQRAQ
eukprot:gene22359-biopygen11743